MPMLNPGEMPHRVAVQEECTKDSDNDGQPDTTELGTLETKWKTVDTVWCGYAERGRVPGSEIWHGQQVSPQVTGKITMRYWRHPVTLQRLTPRHRLIGEPGTALAGRTFNIEVVTNPGERGGTTVMAVFVTEQQ